MIMRTRCECKIPFPDKRYLEIVFTALKPELKKPATIRSRASLVKENELLVLKIETTDTTALRATLNAYLRWISSVVNVLDVLKGAS